MAAFSTGCLNSLKSQILPPPTHPKHTRGLVSSGTDPRKPQLGKRGTGKAQGSRAVDGKGERALLSCCRAEGMAAGMELLVATQPRPWEPPAHACVSALAPRKRPRCLHGSLSFGSSPAGTGERPGSSSASRCCYGTWTKTWHSSTLPPVVSPWELCAVVPSPGPYIPITSSRKAPLHTRLFRRASASTTLLPASHLRPPSATEATATSS